MIQPVVPERMASLPTDTAGRPVPWSIAAFDGHLGMSIVDESKIEPAIRKHLCWLCGQLLGAYKAFVIPPIRSVTRTVGEPPSHRECAAFAAAGGLARQEGVVCVWTTKKFKPFSDQAGKGLLFRIGNPTSTDWYYEGRRATRIEVNDSLMGDLADIEAPAMAQGTDALHALWDTVIRINNMIDKQLGPLPAEEELPDEE